MPKVKANGMGGKLEEARPTGAHTDHTAHTDHEKNLHFQCILSNEKTFPDK